MRGVNKVILVGTLGADPEVKQFPNGGSITTISIATSEHWNDKQTGEKREATEWHRVTFNNKLAEIAAQYLKKGRQVYVEGSLRTRKYQDQSGQDRFITEIRGDQMQMLGSNPAGQSGGKISTNATPASNPFINDSATNATSNAAPMTTPKPSNNDHDVPF